jgi:predicted transcriptional regulator
MTATQVPTRFHPDEVAALDQLVAEGVAESRSAAIRLAVAEFVDRRRRAQIGAAIAAAYAAVPQDAGDDELALAQANALTAAEPW